MSHDFDPGYGKEPFRELCLAYPDADIYPSAQFRVEWGPVFHRGRLDGSARLLVVGQDPAQHESIVRRILVGEAGRRVQGLIAKLGLTRSYVCINTYLYSVYGSVKAAVRRGSELVAYRNRWFSALFESGRIEAVITLGVAAAEAWDLWRTTPAGETANVALAKLIHPTHPESSSKGDRTKLEAATKAMLKQWNAALMSISGAIAHPDQPVPFTPYGDAFAPGDRLPIPEIDMPAGMPAWMRDQDGWASRGSEIALKRRTIIVTVPTGVIS